MKKNLLLLFAATLLIVSCGKKTGDGYVNTIPTTAKFVVSLDLNSMVTKSGVTPEKKVEIITTTVTSASGKYSAETIEKIKQLFENSEAVGIAKDSKIYIFSEGEKENTMALFNVVDKAKLEAMVTTFANDSLCTAPATESDYIWSVMDGKMLLAFNDNSLLICENNDVTKQNAAKFLAQKDGFAGTDSFKKMTANNYDIEFFASMSEVADQLKSVSPMPVPQQMSDLEGLNIVAGLNFENGRAVAKMEYVAETDKAKELLSSQKEMIGQIGSEFIKQIPASLMFMAATNIKGDKVVEYIKAYDVKNEVPEKFFTAISSIDGDVVLSLNGLVQMNPSITALAKVKDKALLDLILENKASFGRSAKISNTSADEYTFAMGGVSVFFGVKDNVMYVTTDKECVANLGKAAKDSFADSQWGKVASDASGYMMINIENILKNEMVKSLLQYQKAFRDPKAMDALNKLSYMEYSATSDFAFEVSLNLKDKNENILKTIFDMAETIK